MSQSDKKKSARKKEGLLRNYRKFIVKKFGKEKDPQGEFASDIEQSRERLPAHHKSRDIYRSDKSGRQSLSPKSIESSEEQ